jgi:hypothetical protein
MSPLVKTKRQANFKDFKRFGAFKGLVEQKNVVCIQLVLVSIGLFWHSWAFKLTHLCQKNPIYTRTRQINYYYFIFFILEHFVLFVCLYRLSQKWRTNGTLRCTRDYRKRQKNVKKILLDLFADWRSLKVALNTSIILKYMYEIVMTATSNRTNYHKVFNLA